MLLVVENIRTERRMLDMSLQQAIFQGNLKEVRRILIENPSAIDEKPNGLWLPYFAAHCGELDIVKYIVEYSRASSPKDSSVASPACHWA